MGERGAVHTYHPTWTEPDPDNPGQRRLRTGKSWAWRFEHRGKLHGRSGYASQKEAQAAGQKRMAEVRAGFEEDPRKLTFEGLRKLCTDEYALHCASTVKQVRFAFQRTARSFAGWLAVDITRQALIAHVRTRLDAGASPYTVSVELAFLGRAMRLAEEQGKLQKVPRFPRLELKPRKRMVRPDELRALLEAARPEIRAVIEVAHEVGWRTRSELLSRQWRNVDFGPATWTCRTCKGTCSEDACPCGQARPGWLSLERGESKTRAPRAFPMTPRLREILTQQRERVREAEVRLGQVIPWVFPSDAWGRLSPEVFAKRWNEAREAAGVPGVRPHDLRGTAASRWENDLRLGRSVSMALGGWRDERTFRNYITVDARTLEDAVPTLSGAQPAEKVTRMKKREG